MKRLRASARVPIRRSPCRTSSSQSTGRGWRESKLSRLPVTDMIGVSELLSSCPSTRTRRCQAWSSSSRRARLTSESTSNWWGRPRSRAVHQLEAPLAVEGEHRHVNLLHHLAQQGRSFERPQPLLLERVPQGVHLDHDLAQRLVTPRSARPDGIVFLAQRGENVGE